MERITRGDWASLFDDSTSNRLSIYPNTWYAIQTFDKIVAVTHFYTDGEEALEETLGFVTFPDPKTCGTIRLVGSAQWQQHADGGSIVLTPAANDQCGGIWSAAPQSLAGGFVTKFRFQVLNGPGADGFAFVLQV